MRERDRLEYRRYLAETEAQERAAEEERLAPIRAAEKQLLDTHKKLIAVIRERLLGNTRDPELFVDERVGPNVRMTKIQADEFTATEARAYFREHPEMYSDELAELLNQYWKRNGIQIATAAMFGNLVDRFRDAGLLPETTAPEPIPEPIPEPEPVPEPRKPETFEGWDIYTGEPRTYTAREVDLMDSLTYRKSFRIYVQQLGRRLPWLAPGEQETTQ